MKNNLIYYIMTYVMFLYPPLIFFLVMINFDNMSDTGQWVTGIIADFAFVLITTGVMAWLAISKRIPKIEKDELNHFIFGYIGNVVVFLYVYQNMIGIERFYSVFSLVLVLVLVYKYLISGRITFKEIFMFSIVFSVLDYLIIIITGNTLLADNVSFTNAESTIFQILFILVLLYSIGFYILKLYRNHKWTDLRFAYIGFLAVFVISYYVNSDSVQWFGTFMVLAFFSLIIDIILRLIHKEFKTIDLVFYARTILLAVVLMFVKDMEIYKLSAFSIGEMGLLIGIFYVTALSDILMNTSSKKQTEIELAFSIEEYLKTIFKPLTSRYKDVLAITEADELPIDLSTMGRKIIIKSDPEEIKKLDLNAISFAVIYSDKPDLIDMIHDRFPKLSLCVISKERRDDKKLKTCFTDFDYYVYTI